MANYLLTGGAGFVGSHLAEALLRRGDSVSVLDNLSTGSVRNLKHLRGDPRFQFLPHGLDHALLAEMVDEADVVYHLAASVGVFNIIDSPVATIVNNIGGTETVLKAAARKRKKVVVFSTSEVYGKSTAPTFREDADLVLGPSCKSRWSYAATKLVDEFLALAYWRELKVPTVVVRLFNTIGPRQVGHYGMVVPRFLGQALKGENLTVYGSGQQSRCFTYVGDVVEWLQRLADDDQAVGEVYNLGNPNEVTITELAERVIALTGGHVGIDYIPYEKAYEQGFEDMQRRVPDIEKVVARTGYAPRVGLDEALTRTRDWLTGAAANATEAPAELVAI